MQLAIWLRGIPPSLGAMLEFQYIENGRFTFIISTILKQNDLRPGLFCSVRFFSSRVCSNGSIHQYMPEKQKRSSHYVWPHPITHLEGFVT